MQVLQNISCVYPVHSGKGPKGYVRQDDKIREDICILLTADAYVDPGNVTVEVKDGTAILNGTVEVELMKIRTEQLAWLIFGIKGVKNMIEVRASEKEEDLAEKQPAQAFTDPKQKK
jgi:osmotically-inducible protein OsmY